MAHASKKKIGAGSQGKGDGRGAMVTSEDVPMTANAVLSNRDKAARPGSGPDSRGQDGKWVQSEQREDSATNRLPPAGPDEGEAAAGGQDAGGPDREAER